MIGTRIIDKSLNIISKSLDKFVTDKDMKARLMSEIQINMMAHEKELTAFGMNIIEQEAKGSLLQRSWRPMLMLTFMALIINSYLIVPYAKAFGLNIDAGFPDQMWQLTYICIGGYVGARTIDKTVGKAVIEKLTGRKRRRKKELEE